MGKSFAAITFLSLELQMLQKTRLERSFDYKKKNLKQKLGRTT